MKLSAKLGVIQITRTHVRAVLVKTGSLPPTVLEWSEMSLPPASEDAEAMHADLVATIRAVANDLKQKPTLWVYNAPQSWSVMRLLSVPFKGNRKVRAALTFELEPYLAIPIEDLMIDFVPIREVNGNTEVLVVGLKRSPVMDHLAVLQEAGLAIESVGLDIVGLSALAYETVMSSTTPSAMLLYHDGGNYLVVMHSKSLAYVQRIVSQPDRLNEYGQEVQNAIRAFQANTAEPVALTEVTCCDPRIDDVEQAHLMELIELPVSSKSLGTSWAPPELLESDSATQWLSLIGTASAGSGGAFSVSFVSDEDSELTAAVPYRRQVVMLGALVAAAFVAYTGVKHLQATRNMAEVDRLGEAVHAEFAATYPDHELAKQRPAGDIGGFKSYDAMLQAIDEEGRTATALTPKMFNQPSLPNVLRAISEHMPNELATVEDISIIDRRSRVEIRIKGVTKRADAFSKMTEGLRSSPLLEFTKEPERQSINNRETFQMILTYRESGPDS